MTGIERDLPQVERPVGLLDAYAANHHVLGGTVQYQRLRLRAAGRFLATHPDLAVWMTRPLPQRLADVSGASSMWPLVTYALISTRVQADAEFSMVKNFGHSMRRWVTALYSQETRLLHDAAERLGTSEDQADGFIAEGLAFVIAFTGKTPATLVEADLDRSLAAMKASTTCSPAMLHRRTATMFGCASCCSKLGWSIAHRCTADRAARPPVRADWR